MNRGLFEAQVNEAWKILTKLNLNKTREWYPNYPEHPASVFRHMSYTEKWKTCFSNQYYHFMLNDNSLIQLQAFDFNPFEVSYSYLECPYQAISYVEFIEQILDEDPDLLMQESYDDISVTHSLYEDFLLTQGMKETVTPIRYDWAPNSYIQGLHPASHVHFGFNNDIRLGTRYILRPISFVLLIIRQCYKLKWKELVNSDEALDWCENVRNNLKRVDDDYFNRLDEFEMMLI